MMQMPLFGPQLWTVTQLNRYMRELLEEDEHLQDIWIQGEISNLSRPASGHIYFTLKDSHAALKCVMFRNAVLRQASLPGEGESVDVHGSINIYEAGGQYQLYADLFRPTGPGVLYQEFLRLKARLEAEGLFDQARKRALPAWPSTIGVVTSPSGAALRDILQTIRRRYPLVKVIISPTQVQGGEAPAGIIHALAELNQMTRPDLIILARGGGSIEDLWAFNDEGVARAIAASLAPVVSGVGHETDFTIADFVADLRAPTPTAAAELATPNRPDLLSEINTHSLGLTRAAQSALSNQRWQLDRLENRFKLRSPESRIRTDRQRLDELIHRAERRILHHLELQSTHLGSYQRRLAALNPAAVLNRGYALVRTPGGALISSVHQVSVNDLLQVQVSDGQFSARVEGDEKQI